ncbi:MAG TPA: YfhE family protein [Candidatus Angelobacter sp.]|nr:YfhE family protein [Candidatus Angelobacter sp.]
MFDRNQSAKDGSAFLLSKKKPTAREKEILNKTQEVLYQREFKRADREYNRSKGSM